MTTIQTVLYKYLNIKKSYSLTRLVPRKPDYECTSKAVYIITAMTKYGYCYDPIPFAYIASWLLFLDCYSNRLFSLRAFEFTMLYSK